VENDIRIMALGGMMMIGRIRGTGTSLIQPLALQIDGDKLHLMRLVGNPERLFVKSPFYSYVPDEQVCAIYIKETTNIIVSAPGGNMQ